MAEAPHWRPHEHHFLSSHYKGGGKVSHQTPPYNGKIGQAGKPDKEPPDDQRSDHQEFVSTEIPCAADRKSP